MTDQRQRLFKNKLVLYTDAVLGCEYVGGVFMCCDVYKAVFEGDYFRVDKKIFLA